MIFFISDGRLGNQIFQYAFLNTLARKGEKVVCVNMDQFLSCFDMGNENFQFITTSRIPLLLYRKIFSKILFFLVKCKLINYIEQVRNETSALPEVRVIKGIFSFTYVKTGFFQTEKLFIPEKIDFKLKAECLARAKQILQGLPESNKVFIHVRRGDYVSEVFQGERGIDLPKQYFINAINEIERNVENPFYVLLTDDPGFVDCCFDQIDNKVVSKEDLNTDLAIMSLCKYGIVSNSSFSWWGAFLSVDKKLMIFPKYWYGWKQKIESHPSIQPSWSTVIDVVENHRQKK